MWVAFDATWYSGGATNVDGVPKADLKRNTRVGATFSMPVARQHALKVAYSTGTTTRFGGDFDTLTLVWQYTWVSAGRP